MESGDPIDAQVLRKRTEDHTGAILGEVNRPFSTKCTFTMARHNSMINLLIATGNGRAKLVV